MGDKLHLPPGEVASEKIFSLLEEKGIETETLREIFRACDMARYARGGLGRSEMQRIYQYLEDFIDQMERRRF
jgi:hypothetical protein